MDKVIMKTRKSGNVLIVTIPRKSNFIEGEYVIIEPLKLNEKPMEVLN